MDNAIIYVCGIHSLSMAIFHMTFWRLFRWRVELTKIGPATRAITQILNLRLIQVFLGVAAACFVLPQQLLGTVLGQSLLGFMALFWLARLVEQIVFLRIRHWMVHLLSAMFALGAIGFLAALLLAL